jgi:glucosylceramidase
MVDATTKPSAPTLYYSPIFYVMRAFSQFIRPQAQVLTTSVSLAANVTAIDYDGTATQDGMALIATAAQDPDGSTIVEVFNETKSPIPYAVVLGTSNVSTTIPPQSLQTISCK